MNGAFDYSALLCLAFCVGPALCQTARSRSQLFAADAKSRLRLISMFSRLIF